MMAIRTGTAALFSRWATEPTYRCCVCDGIPETAGALHQFVTACRFCDTKNCAEHMVGVFCLFCEPFMRGVSS